MYLQGFNGLEHGVDGGLCTPYWDSIEALLCQVDNGPYRVQDLGATLASLLHLSRAGGLGAVHYA
jgi:hypothetical protein